MNDSEKTLQLLALKVGRRLTDRKIEEVFSYPLSLSDTEREAADIEWREAEKAGTRILSLYDSEYPAKLNELPNPPLLIWIKGDLGILDKTLGIIGTRNATLYGREMAKSFAKAAAKRGIAVVSGLARGIDTEAHLGALSCGKTVAVIGSGFSSLYPAENRELADKIGSDGLLISEYPLKTPPSRFQFPARNRIIAALSEKLLVIEAPLKSGSLITVEASLQLKRPIFALPGRIDWENFAGNHNLLKEGKAKLTTSIEDLFPGGLISESTTHEGLLAFFGTAEVDSDILLLKSKLPLPTLNAQLMRLVLQGKIKQLPGGFYKIMS